MKVAKAMIKDDKGSAKSVNSDNDVKILPVSRVVPLSLFRAMMEKTANVRIGATIGVT